MNDIYREINYNYAKLSNAEQEVIDFILKYEDIGKLKLKDIRDKLYVSNATIIRACKKLNFETFTELKYAFVRLKKTKQGIETVESDFLQVLEGIKTDMLATLELVDEKDIDQLCNCLLEARRIFCVGIGLSSQVASEFNWKLKLIDLWTNDYSNKLSIERIPRVCTNQDVIIVFSLNGQIDEIKEVLLEAKNKGATIISVTNMRPNQLTAMSSYSLSIYSSPSNRKKLRSRLMLYVMSTLLYEKLTMKIQTVQ